MSNGTGAGLARSDAPDRQANFFESTEGTYQQTTDRLSGFSNRIDSMCNRMGGDNPPRDTDKVAGLSAEKPSALFDRCNIAEKQLAVMLNVLDDSISRLENIGLL
jgi:hypothetical protein